MAFYQFCLFVYFFLLTVLTCTYIYFMAYLCVYLSFLKYSYIYFTKVKCHFVALDLKLGLDPVVIFWLKQLLLKYCIQNGKINIFGCTLFFGTRFTSLIMQRNCQKMFRTNLFFTFTFSILKFFAFSFNGRSTLSLKLFRINFYWANKFIERDEFWVSKLYMDRVTYYSYGHREQKKFWIQKLSRATEG